jgi:aspartate carbamoyltransferase catalytic subunit
VILTFETADHFLEVINRPIKKVPYDITIANIFLKIVPVQNFLEWQRLSADVISFSAQSSVKKEKHY